MNPAERAAYNAGIEAAINTAEITALTIETGKDAGTFRKKDAAEALAAFAESAGGLMLADHTEASASTKEKNISLLS